MATTLDVVLIRTPDVCGGRLRIDGTRVTVNQIVTLYKRGETPEEISEHFPHVALSQIYTALAYYHSHVAEVVAELDAELAEAHRLEQAAKNSP